MKKTLFSALVLLPLLTFAQQKISIIPSAGYAWRTGKIPDNLSTQEKNYLKQLKSGFAFEVGAYYKLNELVGLGAKYSNFSASASGTFSDNSNSSMQVSTQDKINFIGAGFLYSNFEEGTKHKLYYDMAIGSITYISKTSGVEVKGSNLGLSASIGYMYEINKSFLIGPQVNYTGGTLKKVKVNGQEMQLQEGQYESLHRIGVGLGAGLRF